MAESKTERKVTVILATDVVGYSIKMEENEEQTLKNLKVCQGIIEGLIKDHHGRIFNTAGDSVLAEFQSAVEAVICATEFQNTIKERNNSVGEEEQMEFRVGVNMGDVVIEGDNLYGDGVNIAIFTPSPYKLSPSMTTSPMFTPTLNSICSSSPTELLRSLIVF